MKQFITYISEKLTLSQKNVKISTPSGYTDEELINDYNKVSVAYTKAEKKEIADKYGCELLTIRPIQLLILDKLRENRQEKHEFTKTDIKCFFRYDIPDTYEKFKSYLSKEPDEFVEYLLEHYKKETKGINTYGSISIADRHQLKILSNIQKYLGHE